MKLWLISQNANNGYDTYDSAVVAADSEDKARNTHPYNYPESWGYTWCESPSQVTVKYIGEAAEGTEAGVICASFNAG